METVAGESAVSHHRNLEEHDRLLLAELLGRARAGEVKVIHFLGEVYSRGAANLPANPSLAKVFFHRAARRGHADSQALLASLLIEEDRWEEAFRWFRQAAEGGSCYAQMMLYNFFLAGMVVDVDVDRALQWLDRAAESGGAPAVAEVAKVDEFIFTEPDLNREAGLPEGLVAPLRRRTSWRMGALGLPLYDEMLADLRCYVVRYPAAGYEFLEQLCWLEERVAEQGTHCGGMPTGRRSWQ